MDKNSIDRKKLKYNFLKKIIIRFDYDGMDDTELDQVISSISMELKKHDYTSRTVETEKEMQFEFNDPESGDYAELYGKKIREQKVFVFHNENPQIKLSISSSCACISIEETKYVDCLKHCDVLWKVMSIIISEPEQVPFFIFKRFGLRKTNQCFLRDINRLNEYFEPSHYHVFRIQGEDNIKEKVMQIRDSLEIAGYNANLIRTLVRGELRGEEAYQVNYDADMYLIDSQSIKELMETSVYKGYKQDKIEMRGDRAEMSDFPLYLNTVAGGLDRRDQTIGGFSFVVKIYAVPVVEIIGQLLYLLGRYGFNAQFSDCL